MVQVMNPHL